MSREIFIIAILLVLTAWVVTSWIKAWRAPSYEPRGKAAEDDLDAARQIDLLSKENEGLKGQVSRLEERISVLERIATDPAERTAREIEKLR